MKHRHLFVLSVSALLVLAGCSNDDIAQDTGTQKNEDFEGMTEFAVKEVPPSATINRTMGIYSGSGIDFYWAEGDRLWINNPAADPALIQSTKDNISKQLAVVGDKKIATAKFYFSGTYTEQSYNVRYTGNGNPAGDKVTIKSQQTQQMPNDGSHIGKDGDCGTAIATRNGGRYDFTLLHKASYLTFTPYYSCGFSTDVKVTEITISADEPVAGTYNFDDSGILTDSGTATSKRITLKLNGGGTDGFIIPQMATYTANAAIMVLTPGTYHNFTVEYTLYDQATQVGGSVKKNYGTITCNVGKNKKIATNLDIDHYDATCYMWDAQQPYWKGYESEQPSLNDVTAQHYPKSKTADPQRWYNEVQAPVGGFSPATRTATNCPNVNEMMWYAFKGDPRWDKHKLWEMLGHLWKSGMWLKKKSAIAASEHVSLDDMKLKFNGEDYRYKPYVWPQRNTSIIQSPPQNTTDYFFLPAISYYYFGKFGDGSGISLMGKYGDYWSSTASSVDDKGIEANTSAFNLGFGIDRIGVFNSSRQKGSRITGFQ